MVGLPFPARTGRFRRARGLAGGWGMADGGLDPEQGAGHLAAEGEIETGKEALDQKGRRERPCQQQPCRRPADLETPYPG
jgi:hypothetical protein